MLQRALSIPSFCFCFEKKVALRAVLGDVDAPENGVACFTAEKKEKHKTEKSRTQHQQW
jgi:hypothetical protein